MLGEGSIYGSRFRPSVHRALRRLPGPSLKCRPTRWETVIGGASDRWIALEMGKLQRAFVNAPRPLAELLLEEAPTALTRGGEPHPFDRKVLERFHEALGPLARRRLRLPATFYVDRDMSEDAYLQDEAAMELLRGLGEVPADSEPREGKLWMGHVRARALAARYPGAFQFAYF